MVRVIGYGYQFVDQLLRYMVTVIHTTGKYVGVGFCEIDVPGDSRHGLIVFTFCVNIVSLSY